MVFVFFFVRNGDLTNVIIMLIANLAGVSMLMASLLLADLAKNFGTSFHGEKGAHRFWKSSDSEVIGNRLVTRTTSPS